MSATEQKKIIGGSFLIQDTNPQEIYTPEGFSEAHLKMAQDTQAFMEREVLPHAEAIEKQTEGLIATLLKKAGEGDLLAIDVPTEYGCSGLDFTLLNCRCRKCRPKPLVQCCTRST